MAFSARGKQDIGGGRSLLDKPRIIDAERLRSIDAQLKQLFLGAEQPEVMTVADTGNHCAIVDSVTYLDASGGNMTILIPDANLLQRIESNVEAGQGLLKLFVMTTAPGAFSCTVQPDTPGAAMATTFTGLGQTALYVWSSVAGGGWRLLSSTVATAAPPFRYDIANNVIEPNNPAVVTTLSFSFNGGNAGNTSSGSNSTTLGGSGPFPNTASGGASSVLGGSQNLATATNSAVCGGFDNEASAANAAVLAGTTNTASALNSSVLAGSLLMNDQPNSAWTQAFRSLEGVRSAFRRITAPGVTALSANSDHYLQCDVLLGAQTITLPAITAATNQQVIYVVLSDATATGNTVTIDAQGTDLIVADSSVGGTPNVVLALTGPYTSLHLIANASALPFPAWISVDSGSAGVPASTPWKYTAAGNGLVDYNNLIVANPLASLAIGDGSTAPFNISTGDRSVAFGGSTSANTASADDSSVLGGIGNANAGSRSVIGGGTTNTITVGAVGAMIGAGLNNVVGAVGTDAFIGGGVNNQATSARSAILAGNSNTATANNAVVVGGVSNNATATSSIVGAGNNNDATATNAGVLAGDTNLATGIASCIVAGSFNTNGGLNAAIVAGGGAVGTPNTIDPAATSAFIGAGKSNSVFAVEAFIGAGTNNTASGLTTFIGAGSTNSASNTRAGVVCGISNVGSGTNGFVGGGSGNAASGTSSAVLGGLTNAASGLQSAVAGGGVNLATLDNTFIGAGTSNRASGSRCFVGAGNANNPLAGGAAGTDSGVVAGDGNSASGLRSFVGAGTANVSAASGSGVVCGNANSVAAAATDAGVVCGNGNTNAGIRSMIGGGSTNAIALGGNDSAVIGGTSNSVASTNSTACGSLVSLPVAATASFGYGDGTAATTATAAGQFIIGSSRAAGGLCLGSPSGAGTVYSVAAAATAGGAVLPAAPVGFINIFLNGVQVKVPYYAI